MCDRSSRLSATEAPLEPAPVARLTIASYQRLATILRFGTLELDGQRSEATTSRTHCANCSTGGATVRFFSVTITTGHGRLGKAIGRTRMSGCALTWSIEPGTAAMNSPDTSN